MNWEDRRQIAIWLFVMCALVFGIVVLGGITRLTGSGLSMVEWNPIFGILPPLNEAQWEAVFAQYRESPEYRYVNIGMTVEGFKSIYWFEYLHRMLGRLIGLAFLLPFVYFWVRRKIEPALFPKLIGMFVLGGLQGALGWYMVKSGLADDPHVSQYRLTAHLGLAFVIYVYMFWVALDLMRPRERAHRHPSGTLRRLAGATALLSFITVLSGGFVAGLKAGYAYNTFPKMGGQWIPDGLWALSPAWRNLFENVVTVQFDHRVLALALLGMIVLLWLVAQRQALSGATRLSFHLLLVAALAQVTLGIATLLMHVPITLASAHQGGAVVVLTVLLLVNHQLRVGSPAPRTQGSVAYGCKPA